ncbi:MAG: Mbeg1-like protein [Telluria sp.]
MLDLARFARAAYGDDPIPNSGAWTALDPCAPNSDGYYGQAYINEATHEIVIVHRGTRPTSLADLLNDTRLTFNVPTPAQSDAVNYAAQIYSSHKDYRIINTGHSLGGNDAQAATAALVDQYGASASAVIFDSPGIGGYPHAKTVDQYNVLNLSTQGDLIHLAGGDHLGNSAVLPAGPTSLGETYSLPFTFFGPIGSIVGIGNLLYQAVGPAHSINTIVSYLAHDDLVYGSASWATKSLLPSGTVSDSNLFMIDSTGKLSIAYQGVDYHALLSGDALNVTTSFSLASGDGAGNEVSFSKDDAGNLSYTVTGSNGHTVLERTSHPDGSGVLSRETAQTSATVQVGSDGIYHFQGYSLENNSEGNPQINGVEATVTDDGYGSSLREWDENGDLKREITINADGSGEIDVYSNGQIHSQTVFTADGAMSGFDGDKGTTFSFDKEGNGTVTYSDGRRDVWSDPWSYTDGSGWEYLPNGTRVALNRSDAIYAPNGNLYDPDGKVKIIAHTVFLDNDGKIAQLNMGDLSGTPDSTGKLWWSLNWDGNQVRAEQGSAAIYFDNAKETEFGQFGSSASFGGSKDGVPTDGFQVYDGFIGGFVNAPTSDGPKSVIFNEDGSLNEIDSDPNYSGDQDIYYNDFVYRVRDGIGTKYSASGVAETDSWDSDGHHETYYDDFGRVSQQYWQGFTGDSKETHFYENGTVQTEIVSDSTGTNTKTFDTSGRLLQQKLETDSEVATTNYGADGSSSGEHQLSDGSHWNFDLAADGTYDEWDYSSAGALTGVTHRFPNGSQNETHYFDSGSVASQYNEQPDGSAHYVKYYNNAEHSIAREEDHSGAVSSITEHDESGKLTYEDHADKDAEIATKYLADGTTVTSTWSKTTTLYSLEYADVNGHTGFVEVGTDGDDTIVQNRNVGFITGSKGNDVIELGGTRNIVSFANGDGADTITTLAGSMSTLSLQGINLGDIVLDKSNEDLVIGFGGNDSVRLKGWYSTTPAHGFDKLQVFLTANDYDQASTMTMFAKKIDAFNLSALVVAYGDALMADPNLTHWHVLGSLTGALTQTDDSQAIGGDLALWHDNTNVAFHLDILRDPDFGIAPQAFGPPLF